MAKILTDKEMGSIIMEATHDPGVIDCADSYQHFLEDLLALITDHFGGDPGTITCEETDLDDFHQKETWYAAVHLDDSVPSDGGVYKDYDTDVTWKDGEES